MTEMTEREAVRALSALAQAARLRIYRAVVGVGPAGVTPGTLAATLGIAPSTLSFHMKELLHAGLVTQERDGRRLIYRPSIETMNSLLAYLSEHCCQAVICEGLAPQAAMACIPC